VNAQLSSARSGIFPLLLVILSLAVLLAILVFLHLSRHRPRVPSSSLTSIGHAFDSSAYLLAARPTIAAISASAERRQIR
jgi:hypothetical protein